MNTCSATRQFGTTAEWNRRLQAMYAAPPNSFIEATFNLLRATVTCDFLLFYDFVDAENFPMVRDSDGENHDPVFVQNAFATSPTTAYALAHPGVKLVASRGILPESEEELLRLPIYTDVMRPWGMRHAVCVLYRERSSSPFPETAFTLFRSTGSADFSDEDFAALENAHPHLETGLDCLRTRLASRSKHDGLAAVIRDLPLGSILLNWELSVVYANRSGKKHFSRWRQESPDTILKTERKDCELPTEIESACREIQREWTESIRTQEARRKFRRVRQIEHHTPPGLRATITILPHRAPLVTRPSLLIHIEEQFTAHSRAVIAPPSILDLLTASEREVALKTSEGLSNQEIADQLRKTVSAVKFLQHTVYRKLKIPSRSRLIMMLSKASG